MDRLSGHFQGLPSGTSRSSTRSRILLDRQGDAQCLVKRTDPLRRKSADEVRQNRLGKTDQGVAKDAGLVPETLVDPHGHLRSETLTAV